MRRAALAAGVALALALIAIGPAVGGFPEGVEAYRAGDYARALAEFKPLAEQGHAGSQFALGLLHLRGLGMPRDAVEAARWLRGAAEQGHARAQSTLGDLYLDGVAMKRDDAEAVAWYRKSAAQGDVEGQFSLGWVHERGRGVPQDLGAAADWYRKAAERDHAVAQFRLGALYEEGRGVTRDLGEAAAWYRKSADRGYASGQFAYGWMLEHGRGMSRDEVGAATWYRKAADQGHSAAQFRLGALYEEGRGVIRDLGEAAAWYRKSADRGYASGQFAYGWMLEHGRGISRDEADALTWYRKAADQKHSGAQHQLGELALAGRGTPQSDAEALDWFRKSAEGGHAAGQYSYGWMLEKGRGVARDLDAAAGWYRKAADQGQRDAQVALAAMLSRGRGVSADPAEAVRLLREGAARGDARAQVGLALALLYGRGAEVQRDEARKLLGKAAAAGERTAQLYLGLLLEAGAAGPEQPDEARRWYDAAAAGAASEPSHFDTRVRMSRDRVDAAPRWRQEIDALPKETQAAREGAARQFGRPQTGSRVVVEIGRGVLDKSINQTVAIEVRDPDGARLFAASLSAGERYLVPARADLALYPGNWGGRGTEPEELVLYVTLLVDGVPTLVSAAPDAVGAIRLDPDRLRAGTAVVPPAEAGGPLKRDGRLRVRAVQASRIDVHDEEHLVGFMDRELAAGDELVVPNRPNLSLVVHPRSQVEVVLDGRAVLTLAPPPFRDVKLRLDPDLLGSARVLPPAQRQRAAARPGSEQPPPLSFVVSGGTVIGEALLSAPGRAVDNQIMEVVTAQSLLIGGRTEAAYEHYLVNYQKELRLRGPNSPETVNQLHALAVVDERRDDLVTALARFDQVRVRLEEMDQAGSLDHARALADLARVYLELGQAPDADRLATRALAVSAVLAGGRTDGALVLDAVAVEKSRQQEAFKPDPAADAITGLRHLREDIYHTLGAAAARQRQDERAELYLDRSVLMRELADIEVNNNAGVETLFELERVLRRRGQGTAADTILRHAHVSAKYDLKLGQAPEPLQHPIDLAWTEMLGGPTAYSQMNARALGRLAEAYRRLGRFDEALPLVERARGIAVNIFGPDHPQVAQGEMTLAQLALGRGRVQEALAHIRAANRVFSRKGVMPPEAIHLYLEILDRARAAGLEASAVVDEGFVLAQRARASETAGAVARMAARVAAGAGPLAVLVREQQDLAERRRIQERELMTAVVGPVASRDLAEEQRLRGEIATLDQRLGALTTTIAAQFPGYAELVSPLPLERARAQALMAPEDAMLLYLVGDDRSYLWVLRRDRAERFRLDIGRDDLAGEVHALRVRLDPLLNKGLEPFPAAGAHALYRRLLEPAAHLLADARHLWVVADGPLQSLPFAVLLTEPPPGPTTTPEQHRGLAWLTRRWATTSLPAPSSLSVLRTAGHSRATTAFAGFGNPMLRGGSGAARSPKGLGLAGRLRGHLANVESLRDLPALPETAGELRALARSLGVGAETVFLGDQAREAHVKKADLSHYRVLAFATHGLMAGEFGSYGEPALVLTPPDTPSDLDDGLLGASEIAQLHLDADWVILSACNTAAPDGSSGAEGLSGLAKSFIYAGSRALLVSHWPVESDAAVKLTVGALTALRATPSLGRAEALRLSMLALIDGHDGPPEFAHPLFWAPFVVVGDGGGAAPPATPASR